MHSHTPLGAGTAAFVIIDMQVGHLPSVQSIPRERLVQGTVILCKLAAALGIPIVLTTSRQALPAGGIIPELEPFVADHPLIERTIINAWEDERVPSLIQHSGRTQLIFAGVALDVGVAFAAQSAAKAGYSAIIPVDAVGTVDARLESAALINLSANGVELTSVQAIGMELLKDITSDHATEVFKILGSAHSASDNPFQSL